MARRLVTAPASPLVTLSEIRDQVQLGDDETSFDTLLQQYVAAATEKAEDFTGRAFVARTYDLFLPRFPAEIILEKPPAVSVTSVKYVDTDGVEQTLGSSLYEVDANSEPGRLRPAWLQSWPAIREVYNAVTVRYVAGYGTDPGAVPESLRQAVKHIACTWFEDRSDVTASARMEFPQGSRWLLAPFITPHG